MAMESKHAQEIDAYIAADPDCKKGKQRFEINGKIEFLESYALPTRLLRYNRDNGRFNLEIKEHEIKINRKLDPEDKKDVQEIKRLLLEDDAKAEAVKLKNDLRTLGEQREVAAITWDGVVINGNRRMAVIEELDADDPSGKWQKLWVAKLPRNISDSDLWKIEAGLQLSKAKVADYGPVNNLLMVRQGDEAGLSPNEIARAMYGWTADQVEKDLERLKLIDIFLEFMGQPENYGIIKKFTLSEHFQDIQKTMQQLKTAGLSKKLQLEELKNIFKFLRGNILQKDEASFTHLQIRRIGKMLQEQGTKEALTKDFNKYPDNTPIPSDLLNDNFDNATDIAKNEADKAKPVKLIEKALVALRTIDQKNEAFLSPVDTDSLVRPLKTIATLAKKMSAKIETHNDKHSD
ncbi:MAG: hypothetical protein V6Z81_05065 [Parvularculales bacterium]